jgi:archaellum biogenesis protein FlaJ (TadC family)
MAAELATLQSPRAANRPVAEAKMKEAKRRAGHEAAAAYLSFCFHLLGARLDDRPRRELADRLEQAGYDLRPGHFLALRAVTTVVAAGAFTLISFPLFLLVANWPTAAGLALGGSILAAASTFLAFATVLKSRAQNRRRALEQDLPFTLSELSVLAGIGLSPIQLMRRMASRAHDPAMTAEFRKIIARTDLQGKDVITAMNEVAKESPSTIFRETLWDMANIIHQGGDLEEYLRNQSTHVLENKRAGQELFVGQLSTYADMYVTIVLMGVMFLGIGAFMLDAFRMDAGGLSADGLLMLMSYGLVPGVVLFLCIVLSSAHGQVK